MDNRSLLRFTVYAGIDKAGEGSSPNRVKPVRILDSPQKEEFFFGMPVEGSGRDVLSRRYD